MELSAESKAALDAAGLKVGDHVGNRVGSRQRAVTQRKAAMNNLWAPVAQQQVLALGEADRAKVHLVCARRSHTQVQAVMDEAEAKEKAKKLKKATREKERRVEKKGQKAAESASAMEVDDDAQNQRKRTAAAAWSVPTEQGKKLLAAMQAFAAGDKKDKKARDAFFRDNPGAADAVRDDQLRNFANKKKAKQVHRDSTAEFVCVRVCPDIHRVFGRGSSSPPRLTSEDASQRTHPACAVEQQPQFDFTVNKYPANPSSQIWSLRYLLLVHKRQKSECVLGISIIPTPGMSIIPVLVNSMFGGQSGRCARTIVATTYNSHTQRSHAHATRAQATSKLSYRKVAARPAVQ